jgi:hypothetical protein
MSIAEIIAERGIREVLHFTTNRGLLGILASEFVKSRARLDVDRQLEYVFYPNCSFRRDPAWMDYVNLSITRINSRLFGISSTSWHRDQEIWWCILSFEPVILEHEGVVFTTTNNMYTGVERGTSSEGLERAFARNIVRYASNIAVRGIDLPTNEPTCPQAEVLYPQQLSTEHLQRIYFANELHEDMAAAQAETLNHRAVNFEVNPHVFE